MDGQANVRGGRTHFNGVRKLAPGVPLRGADKTTRIPVKIVPRAEPLKKPDWLKIKLPAASKAAQVKALLRSNRLHTVCEEANCPNLPECFGHGTATFMILGQVCTRRCPFCDVGHGRPLPVDDQEPAMLADAVTAMNLEYVVITSVDRDDLRDGGARHFADCITAVRNAKPTIRVEILTPDSRGRMAVALELLATAPPDIFNHNLETVPRLYRAARPGADYQWSLDLLRRFGEHHPHIPTKSGLMVGLGEQMAEIHTVMRDLRAHGVTCSPSANTWLRRIPIYRSCAMCIPRNLMRCAITGNHWASSMSPPGRSCGRATMPISRPAPSPHSDRTKPSTRANGRLQRLKFRVPAHLRHQLMGQQLTGQRIAAIVHAADLPVARQLVSILLERDA